MIPFKSLGGKIEIVAVVLVSLVASTIDGDEGTVRGKKVIRWKRSNYIWWYYIDVEA